jgi:D-tyrosyl-tRNA(Tyr) deacylase
MISSAAVRAVVQRVESASVRVGGATTGRIGRGLAVLLGVSREDTAADAAYLAHKTLGLRIFPDADGQMNLSVEEVGGGLLVVSQFTLFADARRGRRPSYAQAAPPEQAGPLYELYLEQLRPAGLRLATGTFGAMMELELVNHGPVTILLDSRRSF